MEHCSLQGGLSLGRSYKKELGVKSIQDFLTWDLTFKTKFPTKLVVIKFKDLFGLKFTRSLELYFCACPELSQSWWS